MKLFINVSGPNKIYMSSSNKIWPKPIRAIIFDNDGTLSDTEWAYSWAHKQITGEELSWDLKPQLMGKSALETCKFYVSHYHLNKSPEELVKERSKILEQCWKKVKLLPGATEITDSFKSMGIPMCIATSSRRESFEQKIAEHKDLLNKMHHAVCGSEVKRGKPNPDIFELALEKFNDKSLKPDEIIVFEDSPLGIKAANVLGMASVYVPDPNVDIEKSLAEVDAKATIVIKSLNDFDFNMFDWFK